MRVAIVVLAMLLIAAAAAPAAGPPTATTGAATGLGDTTATVTGTVDANGMATTYHFEYGTSSSYGLQTSEQDAGSGTGAADVQAALAGLTSATTYHYRVVATNAAGVDRGADRTFTTAGPPAASTGSARDVTTTGARLTASVDPNSHPTTYRFEYGTTTRYGKQTGSASAGSGASAVSASANVSGLQPHTRYHYRVVATSAAGTVRGRDRTFTTLRNPRGLTASASPNPAPWGGTTTIAGRLTGQGISGTTVALERQDFPFTGPFYLVGTKTASSSGSFSFTVGPLWAIARLRLTARTTIAVTSPVLEVRNALRVGLRVSRLSGGRVRLQGAVSPRVPNGRASLQKRSPRGRWVVVRRAGVHPLRGGRSRYRFTVRRTGTYRVVVLPRDNFAHVRGVSRERRVR
jgi:Fibronectin type III domain